jgi:hypothetical protein
VTVLNFRWVVAEILRRADEAELAVDVWWPVLPPDELLLDCCPGMFPRGHAFDRCAYRTYMKFFVNIRMLLELSLTRFPCFDYTGVYAVPNAEYLCAQRFFFVCAVWNPMRDFFFFLGSN